MLNYHYLLLTALLIEAGCSSPVNDRKTRNVSEKEQSGALRASSEEQTVTVTEGDLKDLKIPIPKNYLLLDSVCGDLDKDNIPELVVAYTTSLKDENDGFARVLCIYQLKNENWVLWKESKKALLGSEDGGMMGDPFGGIEIAKGILSISHNGGSSWKWNNTDKYRFRNNDFELIGFESVYGKPCEYWQTEDFNVSTGKFDYKKEIEGCENGEQETSSTEKESFYKKGIRLTLSNRYDKEISFKTPKGEDIYL